MTHKESPAPPPPSISAEDILFVLFRHKWKILTFSILGLVAAALLYFQTPPVYQSETKLLLRYVLERKSLGPITADSQIQSPTAGGENIINSELEILGSFDLAVQVARAIGPEKLLAKSGGGNSVMSAARLIKTGLSFDVPRMSSVIRVVFKHPDPAMVQPVLEKVIENYFKKHLEVHRAVGLADEYLSQQMESLRFKLAKTEEDLWNVQTNAGFISSDDLKSFGERRMKILVDLSVAQAGAEERKAAIKDLEKVTPSRTNAAVAEIGVPMDKLSEYRSVSTQLTALTETLPSLLLKYADSNPLVQRVKDQIAGLAERKAKMEEENPKLVALGVPSGGAGTQFADVSTLLSEARAFETRIRIYNSQLEQIQGEELAFAKAQSTIDKLRRQKEVEETNYKYYSSSLEQARIDETLDSSKMSNIKTVQEPSPPSRDTSKEMKPAGMVLAAGLLAGVALAFLIELLLDQTIKRPREIQARLHWPLFLCIPDTATNGHASGLKLLQKGRLKFLSRKSDSSTSDSLSQENGKLQIAPWDARNGLRPYCEQLRDRLMLYFDSRNMTQKPKLIALTSCSNGSGVSTIAIGLAASLSETGDGNVLVVDLNSERGTAHPFYHGKPGCALPDVFEDGKRDSALVQEKLYLVKGDEADGELSRFLPKKLADLIPKMKASDYDYIIFDMPPIAQTSVMLRLASHMHMVFMVIEAEKTNRADAKRASSLLAEAKANVTAILNKRHDSFPAWLQMES